MKNVFLSLACLLIGSFAFANVSDEKKVEETKDVVVAVSDNKEKSVEEVNEEGVHCKVVAGNKMNSVTLTCWFCSCKKLAEKANEMLQNLQ